MTSKRGDVQIIAIHSQLLKWIERGGFERALLVCASCMKVVRGRMPYLWEPDTVDVLETGSRQSDDWRNFIATLLL